MTACKVQAAVKVVVLCIIHILTATQHHDWPHDPVLCPLLVPLPLHRSFQRHAFAKEVFLELVDLTKRNTARVDIPAFPCGVDSRPQPQS